MRGGWKRGFLRGGVAGSRSRKSQEREFKEILLKGVLEREFVVSDGHLFLGGEKTGSHQPSEGMGEEDDTR